MAEVIIKDKSISEPPVGELHPLRTTVQGTQQDGVEHGHEHRDIDAPAIGRWFIVLIGIILFTYIAMMLMLKVTVQLSARNDKLPSPLATTRQVPPGPYIEGLSLGGEERAGTVPHLKAVREKDAKTLKDWGLIDEHGINKPVAADVVNEVAREGAAAEPAKAPIGERGPGVSLH